MAANKANSKTKERTKVAKSGNGLEEDVPGIDYSILRKSIITSVTGLGQAIKVFESSTEELKTLLSQECELIYECKVCRNIYRSLANFISHKRVYCSDKFNPSFHTKFSACNVDETKKIMEFEEGYQEFVKNKDKAGNEGERELNPLLTKDITEMLERASQKESPTIEERSCELVALSNTGSSSSTVMETQEKSNTEKQETIRSQMNELHKLMSKDCAVLREDGTFVQMAEKDALKVAAKENENNASVTFLSDDEEQSSTLQCKQCNINFSTRKTLKFHMKCKHLESRKVYTCPDCLELFSTSWSVFRHLFKVHRKTAAQVRRLRDWIQAKAFLNNKPPAFYERRRNIKETAMAQTKLTEEERIDQENQAWMENIEMEGEVPKCGGCGRKFERRAALAAHTQTCQPRRHAIKTRTPIHIQVRRDYNKTVNKTPATTEKSTDDTNKPSGVSESNMEPKETRTQTKLVSDVSAKKDEPKEEENNEKNEREPSHVFIQAIEKDNMDGLKELMKNDMDIHRVYCKICRRNYSKIHSLYRHMAQHYHWKRFICKLCDYPSFERDKILLHVRNVHKMKGDQEFYFSIIKVLNAAQAKEMSKQIKDNIDNRYAGRAATPASSRGSSPSRCSSPVSLLLDNENSNSVEDVSSRKKPAEDDVAVDEVPNKKAREDSETTGDKDYLGQDTITEKVPEVSKSISMANVLHVIFGEEREDSEATSSTYRRPVRKRSKPKNSDYEYDLSNILKHDKGSYRENKDVTVSAAQKPVVAGQRSREPSVSQQRPSNKRKSSNDSLESTPPKEQNKVPIQTNKHVAPMKTHTSSLTTMSMSAISQARAHPSFNLSVKSGVASVAPHLSKLTPVKIIKVPSSAVQIKIPSAVNQVKVNEVIDLDCDDSEKNLAAKQNNDSAAKKVSSQSIVVEKPSNPLVNNAVSVLSQNVLKQKVILIKGALKKGRAPIKVYNPMRVIGDDSKKEQTPVVNAEELLKKKPNGDAIPDLTCEENLESALDDSVTEIPSSGESVTAVQELQCSAAQLSELS